VRVLHLVVLLWVGLASGSALFSSSIVIDCGSASDTTSTGTSSVYTITQTLPAGTDPNLRFSSTPFGYKVPVANGPHWVRLEFLEPSVQAPGQRLFNVFINDQPMLSRLDPFAIAGYLKPFSRTVLAVGSDGFLNIRFETITRSAIISQIVITPMELVSYISPSQQTIVTGTGILASWITNAYNVPRADPVAKDLQYNNEAVYRNGLRQSPGVDYFVTSRIGNLQFRPMNSEPWGATDVIAVDYVALSQ
jgi:hypothetical protein